jgi:hypothetical protein
MILLLDELNIFGINSNLSVIVEKHFIKNLKIESVDFIETKFTKTKSFEYNIIKKLGENFNSSLRLKHINDYKKIYSISWSNPETLISDFSTYVYIEDYSDFIKEKKHYEKHLGVTFGDIKKVDMSEILENKFDNIDEAAIKIIAEQGEVKTPSILYYIFEDVLEEKKMKTLKRISFI